MVLNRMFEEGVRRKMANPGSPERVAIRRARVIVVKLNHYTQV